jgi:hypothetical protein
MDRGDAAIESGNSEKIIRDHYLSTSSVTQAKAFWKIEPKEVCAKSGKKIGFWLAIFAALRPRKGCPIMCLAGGASRASLGRTPQLADERGNLVPFRISRSL